MIYSAPRTAYRSGNLSKPCFLLLATCWLLAVQGLHAQTWYVNAAAAPGGNGTTWASAFKDVQLAINAASSGHQIWVAEGTYKPTSGTDRSISFVMKPGVEILGGFPNTGNPDLSARDWVAHPTILSGNIGDQGLSTDNSYHVIFNNFTSGSPLTSTAVLDGFTITGGYASDIAPHCHGGGMYNLYASPTVTNCIFSNNTAQRSNATSTDSRGGGMYNSYSAPSVTYCIFSGNEARAVNSSGQNYGGAMYNDQSTMTVSHCTFNNNTTPNSDEDTYGGGICNLNMTITINDCAFSGNAACYGGGVYSSNSATTTNNCTFSANALDTYPGGVNGSGMFLNACSGSVAHCDFTGNLNHAALGIQHGSPIEVSYCTILNNPVYGMTLQTAAPNITNCLFAGNNFGGLANWNGGVSAPVITNCTFSENPSFPNLGAITNYGSSTATVKNCILWGAGPSVYNPNGVVNISYSDVKQVSGIYPGTGNINADPLFVSATDFHLQNGSPCKNTGTATGAPADDFDGDARPIDGGFDMGYDENTFTCPPPSCSITGEEYVCNNSSGNIYTAPAGMASYSWSISGGGTIQGSTTGQSISVTAGNFIQDYTVFVTITDGNGCSSNCSKQSFIYLLTPTVNITATPSSPACLGVTLSLSTPAAASSTVSWTGEGIGNPSGNFVPDGFGDFNNVTTALPISTGMKTYTVFITSSASYGGCSNTGTLDVEVIDCCPAPGSIWYVNAAVATPFGNGASWDCAFRDLQQALTAASPGDQIWVAEGTYKPTNGSDRSIFFNIKNGVKVLGGFPNTGSPGLGDRDPDPATNGTVLSGDIGTTGLVDNSYHVVWFDHTNNNTILDGFTITGGNGETTQNGGGIYNDGSGVGRQSNPRILNCIITGNVARNGGGLFNDGYRGNSSPDLVNCVFSGNKATRDGGATYNFGGNNGNSSPVFTNVVFSGNKAERIGGGVFNDAVDSPGGVSSPVFVNCTFSGNQADFGVGAMYNDAFTGICSPSIINCILWGNAGQIDNRNATPVITNSIVQGAYTPCTDCLNADPFFISQPPVGLGTTGNLRLQICSPAIDAAKDSDAPANDLDGNARFDALTGGSIADMGAYEFQSAATPTVAVCQSPVDAFLDNNGQATVLATALNNGSTGCSPLAFSINGQSSIAFNCSQIGSQSVTLTATYINRVGTCTATVNVKDNIKPTITCPANTTVAANASCQGMVGSYSAATLSDNCNPSPTATQSPAASTVLTGHNTAQTVTLTANDGNGNTTACTFTVTLKDITPPSISCPANATVAANASCQGMVGSYSAATLSDNCNPSPTVTQSPAASTVLTGHNTAQTVTLTANDGNGNTTACTFTVTLKDITPPSISCPANTTVAANASCQGMVGSYSAATLSDNCNPSPTVTQSPAASTVLTGHNTAQTVTLTANDGNGNTTACTFTVTLKDITPPSISCPANTTVAANASCQGMVGSYSAATLSDNCNPSPMVIQSPASSTVLTGHNTAQTVTLTANDGNGNTTACTLVVTLKDITPPSIVCPNNRTVNADANLCSSTQTYTVTASDNCSYTLTRTNGLASGTAFPLGLNVVNWQVTDAGGSSTICSFSITVIDAQTPTITCPNSSTVAATPGLCAAVVNYSVNGSDNCSGWSLLRTNGLQSGALFPVGTNTVIWRNTDTGGNSSTCSFTVTVTDGQLPGITCPANITANAAGGSCAATVNYTTPSVSDNCSVASAMHVSGGTSGSSFNKGVNTVQWKATDGANNTRTCSFTITVNDTQAPTITCPVNITANTGANNCAATVNFNNATATDNCTPPPTVAQTGGGASGSSFPKGMHTITFLATDGVGLTKACTFRITVVDNVLPTINCPGNIVKNTDNNLCSAVTNYTVTGTDNCTSVSVSRVSGLASGVAFPRGSSTVIWRATDLAGNSTLCSFTVTVNDAQLPNISCPASISTNTTTGQCSKVVNYTTPTYSDNCAGGNISLFSGLASGSVFPTGVSTVIWRAFDNSANSADCAFTITVTDNELPVVTCPPSATVAGNGSPCGYPSAQLSTPSATDNCAVTSLASDAPASLPAGVTTIIWTAGDAAGNQKTCAYTVTVNCGASAGAKDEVGGMKDEARTSLHSLIPHPSSLITHHLSLSPNPASDIVVITLSNQQINSKSNQQSSASNQQINNKSNQQLLLHDALGREVWRKTLAPDVEQITIDLVEQRLQTGVYQVSWWADNVLITKSLVIIGK